MPRARPWSEAELAILRRFTNVRQAAAALRAANGPYRSLNSIRRRMEIDTKAGASK